MINTFIPNHAAPQAGAGRRLPHQVVSRRRAHPGWQLVRAFGPPLAACLLACGASGTELARGAPRVPVAHLSDLPEAERARSLSSLPVVLEIRKGDRFPIEAVLDSTVLRLHNDGEWSVEALEPFYVLLRPEGPPLLSSDGVDFDQRAQNSFNFGFGAERDRPTKLRIALSLRAGSKQ
jgi:hypothetical protein